MSVLDLQKDLPVYQFRKDRPEYIVGVHCVERAQNNVCCSSN